MGGGERSGGSRTQPCYPIASRDGFGTSSSPLQEANKLAPGASIVGGSLHGRVGCGMVKLQLAFVCVSREPSGQPQKTAHSTQLTQQESDPPALMLWMVPWTPNFPRTPYVTAPPHRTPVKKVARCAVSSDGTLRGRGSPAQEVHVSVSTPLTSHDVSVSLEPPPSIGLVPRLIHTSGPRYVEHRLAAPSTDVWGKRPLGMGWRVAGRMRWGKAIEKAGL